MIVPVTVIGSVVVCLFFVALVCANASGAISKQARVIIVFFMMSPFDEQISGVVWIEQEPLRGFAIGHFYLAPQRDRVRPSG